jgi:hypothetical protein
MHISKKQLSVGLPGVNRRAWLVRAASAGGALLTGIARSNSLAGTRQEQKTNPADEAARELERAGARVSAATKGAVRSALSARYQAVGDAAESFMRISLADCELIAQDFLDYYGARGFAVKPPERRMTIVALRDERPFVEFARKSVRSLPKNATGFYSRSENWLVNYDSRNVPASERGGALKNVRNLAHEATHQLTFNTGMLNRKGDVPLAIVEGLACYGETRRLRGHTEPGLLNSERLDDLAHVQRGAKWIETADLLTDDSPAASAKIGQTLLFYAQSYLLICTLMNSRDRVPQFQAYLKTIFPRVDKKNRLADATKCFGELNQLDQELRREAIRLQKEPRP